MSIEVLTSAQINALVGSRHSVAGIEYPPDGLQPYYQWLIQTLHLLAEASAGALRVVRDDTTATTVLIAPGQASIEGTSLTYAGGVHDLSTRNNQTSYLWLEDDNGAAAIGIGGSDNGWPSTPHVPLGEVVIDAGEITAIFDRRWQTLLAAGHAPSSISTAAFAAPTAAQLVRHSITVTSLGDTTTPSTVQIAVTDVNGGAISETAYVRVRICQEAGWAISTQAAVAVGANTTVVETIQAGKDVVLKSNDQGVFQIEVSDSQAETVTLRIGAPPVTSSRADFTATVDITHA